MILVSDFLMYNEKGKIWQDGRQAQDSVTEGETVFDRTPSAYPGWPY